MRSHIHSVFSRCLFYFLLSLFFFFGKRTLFSLNFSFAWYAFKPHSEREKRSCDGLMDTQWSTKTTTTKRIPNTFATQNPNSSYPYNITNDAACAPHWCMVLIKLCATLYGTSGSGSGNTSSHIYCISWIGFKMPIFTGLIYKNQK